MRTASAARRIFIAAAVLIVVAAAVDRAANRTFPVPISVITNARLARSGTIIHYLVTRTIRVVAIICRIAMISVSFFYVEQISP